MSTVDQARGLHLVISATGHVELATRGGQAWLTASRTQRLADIVCAAEPAETFERIIDGTHLNIVRAYGATTAYIATIAATTTPELSPARVLTARQLEVAEYAAAGATAREIAQTLNLSFDPVRDHLMEAYRRLDVASRAELVNALRAER